MSDVPPVYFVRPTGQFYGSWHPMTLEDENPWADKDLIIVPYGALSADYFWNFETEEYYLPPPTPAQILASQSAILVSLKNEAEAQKTALTNRIGVINDSIELEMATPEEEAELPVRTAQLKAWKTYAVLLGRVTTQAGWPPEVVWPTKPTSGMDLTTNSITSPSIL